MAILLKQKSNFIIHQNQKVMNWNWELILPILLGGLIMVFAVFVKYGKEFKIEQIIWRALLGVAIMITLTLFVEKKLLIGFAFFLASAGLIYFIGTLLDRLKKL